MRIICYNQTVNMVRKSFKLFIIMASKLSRRGFIGCAAASVLSLGCSQKLSESAKNASILPGSTFSFVHLTDLHIRPERNATKGVTACLKAVNKLNPKPDFLLTGGDLVMDVTIGDFERATLLFDLLVKTFRDYAGIPVRHCIGNHDIFALSNQSRVNHPQYGKKMFWRDWICLALIMILIIKDGKFSY